MTMRNLVVVVFVAVLSRAPAEEPELPAMPCDGDALLARYFEIETARIEAGSLADIATAAQWKAERARYRAELEEMLGLRPMPPRTDLTPVVTGTTRTDDVIVERLHFQSRPGLYVTANFYRPAEVKDTLPAILYVCGHGASKQGKISFGNKVSYHHHGLWFARHGYVCLTIDSLQLGEIEGVHHGTHRLNRWWWHSLGYTPAGVEAWNCIRALDYLETRPEVDRDRIGVTGRSGGGIYSWWITALDDRIRVAAPVAGITSLRNHVVDGVVEGHCDCMFHVNTYRWDFEAIAALAAPRPLLVVNTDKDTIFPLDGVVRVYERTRRIYRLLGKEENIGLALSEGPHKDTQPLRVAAFHWFERHLKGRSADDEIADATAPKSLLPEQLRVFEKLPGDEINTRIDETFVVAAKFGPPDGASEWGEQTSGWMRELAAKSFRAWPEDGVPLEMTDARIAVRDGVRVERFDFLSQEPYRLPLFVCGATDASSDDLDLVVLDEPGWQRFLAVYGSAFPALFDGLDVPLPPSDAENARLLQTKKAVAFLAPRGIGPTAWSGDARARTHLLRRFALLGQTLDGMRVWDIRRALQALRARSESGSVRISMRGRGAMAGNVLYAALFEPAVAGLELEQLPASYRDGPIFLNVLRTLDLPQAVAMAAERMPVRLTTEHPDDWEYVRTTVSVLGFDAGRFAVTPASAP